MGMTAAVHARLVKICQNTSSEVLYYVNDSTNSTMKVYMTRPAPNFKLPDQDGNLRTLADYKGEWLVLFFYPKDRSLNCTKEVCAFRDEHSIIGQFGNAEIVGINKDSVASHKRFSQKVDLNFPLLSDSSGTVTKAYGAWRSNKPRIYDTFFATRRNTYLINPKGMIVKEYMSVSPTDHALEVIEDLQKLTNKSSRI